MATSPVTSSDARKVRPQDACVGYLLLAQHRDLPLPTSMTVEDAGYGRTHVFLALNSVAEVDAWAEAMNVDVDSELHNDGTWTDYAVGELPILTGQADRWEEMVRVSVYAPQIDARTTAHPVSGPPVDNEPLLPGVTGAQA